MAQMPNDKLDSITDEVTQLHPLLGSVLQKLPRVVDVEYTHGNGELGADFVIHRTEEIFGGPEYVGVIGKVGKLPQDLTTVERQIEECDLPRLFRGGREKIRITEIWVIATQHITRNAQEKIHDKYRNRKIVFIDGKRLEKLVDKYAPLAWSGLPIDIVEYLQDLRIRTEEQDRSVSLLQLSDEAFYVKQDLYYLPDIEYRYRAKGSHTPHRVEVEDLAVGHRSALIEGGVGSGKSKLLRRITMQASQPDNFIKNKVLPVTASYTELVQKYGGSLLKLVETKVPPKVRELCRECEYLVLVDGFDERRMDVNLQAEELTAVFSEATPENRIRVAVTSRFLKGVERANTLPPAVSRCELRALSMQRTIEIIMKMCAKLNVKDRILEDLKKSPLFRDLPRSPMSAILLARLLNENQQEIPSNMTELYSKYSELILGRWDERKGLQSQKEYQALDNIMMNMARIMVDDQRLFISIEEAKGIFKEYLDQRNLELDVDELFQKMVDRCEILTVDELSGIVGFKHRTFVEFFYAKSNMRDKSLVIDNRAFNVYWANTFFFYLGLRKDAPEELRAIFDVETRTEYEEWLKVMNLGNFMLAAYTTPYEIVAEGVRNAAIAGAKLYQKIVSEGTDSPFGNMPRMHLLYLLQYLMRYGYSYKFFGRAMEEAALAIDDMELDEETKAYALFFLNVTYITLGGTQTFDFMLARLKDRLPLDLQLALGHEGAKLKERSTLMRKQDRQLRHILQPGLTHKMFVRNFYDRSVNAVSEESEKAQQRKERREEAKRLPARRGKQ